VLLAWRFFRERLLPHQWAGIAVILVGILIVSV
jgi:drug/metabolite transporter (DMT)-like permease